MEAWHLYEGMPLPDRRSEEWRYTDATAFKLDKVKPAYCGPVPGVPDGARAKLAGRAAAGTVIQVDGCIAEIALDPELAAKGVLLLHLNAAASSHRDLVEKHLGNILPASFNKFAALNSALWDGGIFLYVPRGVRIDQP